MRARVARQLLPEVTDAVTFACITPPGGVEVLVTPSSVAPVLVIAPRAAPCKAAKAVAKATKAMITRVRRASEGIERQPTRTLGRVSHAGRFPKFPFAGVGAGQPMLIVTPLSRCSARHLLRRLAWPQVSAEWNYTIKPRR